MDSNSSNANTYKAVSALLVSLVSLATVILNSCNTTVKIPIDKLKIDSGALEIGNPVVIKSIALCLHEFDPQDIQIWTRNMDGTLEWVNLPIGTEIVEIGDELSGWGFEQCEPLVLDKDETLYKIKSYEFNPDERDDVVYFKIEN